VNALELIRPLLGGHIILVAEFRGGKLESIGYVDKTSGLALKRFRLSFAVERQGKGLIEHVNLIRYLLPQEDPDKIEIKLEKGSLYAFPLEAVEQKRGMMVGRMSAGEPVMIDSEGEPLGPTKEGLRPPNLVYYPTTPQQP
jgi:hypothetical protein